MTIGICDWGIGGVGLYQLIRERSTVDVIYFSDTGFTPYGKVLQQELKERISVVKKYLHSLGAEKVAIACNAASTVIEENDDDVTGVIVHGLRVTEKANAKEVGVAGGQRTIESNIYKNLLAAKGIDVNQRNAQPLSGLIEEGELDSETIEEEVKMIFAPLNHLKFILLACTHYPLIREKIREVVPNATLLDPAPEMAQWIFDHWRNMSGSSVVKWLTSGDAEKMKFALKRLYNLEASDIKKINL